MRVWIILIKFWSKLANETEVVKVDELIKVSRRKGIRLWMSGILERQLIRCVRIFGR